jgi:hypothetical protein
MVSRNSRFKAKELLLLLLPAIGLAAMGFALRHREATGKPPRDTSGPTQLIVTSIKRRPATPREVALGFDTGFAVTLDHKGASAADWGKYKGWFLISPSLFYEKAGKRVYLDEKTDWRAVNFDKAQDVFTTKFALPLSRVNHHTREIFFETEIGVSPYTMGGARKPVFPIIPILFKVRNANQIVLIPKVSRYRPFTLSKVSVTHFNSGAAPSAQVEAILNFHDTTTKGVESQSVTAEQTYLQDERKKRYFLSTGYSTSLGQQPIRRVTWHLDGRDYPAGPKHLTLKTQLSVDDCWPLPISVVVRNARKPR